MNYFDFFRIEKAFEIDEVYLRQKYLENSKKFHPDYYIDAQAEAQEEALRNTSLNNEAYQTLKNYFTRLEYILKTENIISNDEKYSLSPQFLMEMMEINEAISALSMEDSAQISAIKNEVEQSIQENEMKIKKYVSEVSFPMSEQNSDVIKKLYYERKYILRIKERLNTFAH